MQIQYAVFCETIDFPKSSPVFKHPVTNLITNDIAKLSDLEMPLLITFVNGTPGGHHLKIEIVTPAREITLPDFKFNWPPKKVSHGEIFTVKFQPDIFGLYTFRLIVDGEIMREIQIPIIQEK